MVERARVRVIRRVRMQDLQCEGLGVSKINKPGCFSLT